VHYLSYDVEIDEQEVQKRFHAEADRSNKIPKITPELHGPQAVLLTC
jgi:hypothetical protein